VSDVWLAAAVGLALVGVVAGYVFLLRFEFRRSARRRPCPRCGRPLGRAADAASDFYQLGGRERDLLYGCRHPVVARCGGCGAECVLDDVGRVMGEFGRRD
jgi:hypothetical protein